MSSLLTTHFFTSTASFKCERSRCAARRKAQNNPRSVFSNLPHLILARCKINGIFFSNHHENDTLRVLLNILHLFDRLWKKEQKNMIWLSGKMSRTANVMIVTNPVWYLHWCQTEIMTRHRQKHIISETEKTPCPLKTPPERAHAL